MNEPIENLYFNWLCAKVLDRDTEKYASLMELLFNYEFVWVVPEDSHRLQDGIELRTTFYRETFTKKNKLLNDRPCSIFEMLIAFSNRASFQTEIPAYIWFWEFLENLGVLSVTDVSLIQSILYAFTWRIYEPNGDGNIFPLSQTNHDQRKIELWYQFNEYLYDRGLI